MLFAFLYSCLRLLLDVVDVRLRVRDPEAELLLLRHQLRVLRPQVQRPDLEPADRVIMAALSRVVNRAALVGLLVQPATVLGWHRELVRRRWAKTWPRTTGFGSRDSNADPAHGEGQPEEGLCSRTWGATQARLPECRRRRFVNCCARTGSG